MSKIEPDSDPGSGASGDEDYDSANESLPEELTKNMTSKGF